MKELIKVDQAIPWIPKPGEGRLYLVDAIPPREQCATAFGFVFVDERILLTRLADRDWDIPGGMIEPGETPEDAAIREVWEETCARVAIVEPIGIQEVEVFGPKPSGYRWPYPISVQVYYLCTLVELGDFTATVESRERGFFAPEAARLLPTMTNHDRIYEEALRRVRLHRDNKTR